MGRKGKCIECGKVTGHRIIIEYTLPRAKGKPWRELKAYVCPPCTLKHYF